MRLYKTPDYHRIKTGQENQYYWSGIPSLYWGGLETTLPKFKLIVIDEENSLSQKQQSTWMSKLWEGDLFQDPLVVLITSDFNDSTSARYAFDLLKRALGLGLKSSVSESSDLRREFNALEADSWTEDSFAAEQVVMLYNLFEDTPINRLQEVRDWTKKHQGKFRILAASGDPLVLMDRLKIEFNAVFHLDSKLSRETTTEKTLA